MALTNDDNTNNTTNTNSNHAIRLISYGQRTGAVGARPARLPESREAAHCIVRPPESRP